MASEVTGTFGGEGRSNAETGSFEGQKAGVDPDVMQDTDATQTSGGEKTERLTPQQPHTPASAGSGAADRDAFVVGDVVAERYRILRFIARGGMGEVYEAKDEELGGVVALKTIRTRASGSGVAIERFKREIQIARQVTHPNVSRIFDIEKHRDRKTGEEVLFLTMEYLPGDTLRHHVQDYGKLSVSEALPLVEQMAEGLGEAHKKGIVHRDFKSANVMLMKAGESRHRAVVTDFGLAKVAAEALEDADAELVQSWQSFGDVMLTLTGTGSIVGTPAYMAPEQVAGEEVAAAADIYALGVVVYEMLTGVLPFAGSSSLLSASERKKMRPRPPREVVGQELPEVWERVILKCMEIEPSARYQSVEEVLSELRPKIEPIIIEAPMSRTKKLVGMAAGIVLAAVTVASVYTAVQKEAAVFDPSKWKSVAVLGFKNLGGAEDGWLSTALVELLRPALAAGGQVRVVQADTVARVKTELGLKEADNYPKEKIEQLRVNLNADMVVVGSYMKMPAGAGKSSLKLNLSLLDTETGEVFDALSEEGTAEELFALVSKSGLNLRRRLGLNELEEKEMQSLSARLPTNTEAMKLYSQGLDKLNFYERRAARDLLKQAVILDPEFALARSALSKAYFLLGNEPEAKIEAKKAFDLSDVSKKLPRYEALVNEAWYYEVNAQKDKSIEIWRSLVLLAPEEIEYALGLVKILRIAEKLEEALQTLHNLEIFKVLANKDPRILIVESDVLMDLGNADASQKAASKAYDMAKAHGATLLMKDAEESESWALFNLGQYSQSLEKSVHAKKVSQEVGDFRTAATNAMMVGASYERLGDLLQAQQNYQETIQIFNDLQHSNDLPYALMNLASVLIQRGKLEQASRFLDEGQNLARKLGYSLSVDYFDVYMGWIEKSRGDLGAAAAHFEQARASFRSHADERALAWLEWHLGDLYLARGDLGESKELLQALLERQIQKKLLGRITECRISLASIAIEESRFKDAEELAKTALEQAEASKSPDNKAQALRVMTEALLGEGLIEDAKRIGGAALKLAETSQNLGIRFHGLILGVQLEVIGNASPTTSEQKLEDAIQEANESKLTEFRWKLQLALAQVKKLRGKQEDSRLLLELVAKEAGAANFGTIAKLAQSRQAAPK